MTEGYRSNWESKIAENMWQQMLSRRCKEIADMEIGEPMKRTLAPPIWHDYAAIKMTTKEVLEETKDLMLEVEQNLEHLIEASKSPNHKAWNEDELGYVKKKYTQMADQLQMDCVSMNQVLENEHIAAELITGTWAPWINKAGKAFQ